MPSPLLFTPLRLRGLTVRNRVAMSPMCQYCARDGLADDWHLVHLGSRAVGGAGLVMVEATAVAPEGRISPGCLGLWNDAQADALARIARFVRDQSGVPGIQLAHAGRKGSCQPSWRGGAPLAAQEGAWEVPSPSAIPFDAASPVPRAADAGELAALVDAYGRAARRAVAAGFALLEIHAAHGYLLHQFLSPLSNRREDSFGGSFENRTRLLRQVVTRVRDCMPDAMPLFVRISAKDWAAGGWDLPDAERLSAGLSRMGVDLIDVSSGGLLPDAAIAVSPGYQVPLARSIRRAAGVPTAAVGLITDAAQAEAILAQGAADLVFLGRELLRDPYWPQKARHALGLEPCVPAPYRSAVRKAA
ncbi:MAG: NADH:flavin oxidoreductase/NADH oxidase [Pseudomonadota bacterium]